MPIDLNSHFHSFQAFQTLSIARFLSLFFFSTLLSLPTSLRVLKFLFGRRLQIQRESKIIISEWMAVFLISRVRRNTMWRTWQALDQLLNTLKRLSHFDSVRYTQRHIKCWCCVCVALKKKQKKRNDGSLGLTITRYIESAFPEKKEKIVWCVQLCRLIWFPLFVLSIPRTKKL